MAKIDRQKVYQKYGGHCAYCGKEITIKEMQVDHIHSQLKHKYEMWFHVEDPLNTDHVNEVKNRIHNEENLNPSCRRCNFYKGSQELEQFRQSLKSIHQRIIKPFILKLGQQYGIVEIKVWDGVFYFEKCESRQTQ